MKKHILAAAAATFLMGCTVSQTYPRETINQLKPGVSTIGDATRLLGEPVATSKIETDTLVQWIDIQGWPFRKHGAHLAILFDSGDKMVRITHQYDAN